jgi:pyruvoyl-dependent arginine decarboxylase (PvlArgDC)
MISLTSGLPASFSIIKEEGLIKLIKEGNQVKIAYDHSKCNVEYDQLVTHSVQTHSGGW